MNVMPFMVALATMAAVLGACTTTKDLERRPEYIAVDGPKQDQDGRSAAVAERTGAESGAGVAVTRPDAKTEPASNTSGAGRTSSAGPVGSPAAVAATPESAGPPAPSSATPSIVEKRIYVDRPIYYPDSAPQTQPSPGESVEQAMNQGVMRPKDYNGALMLYDYDASLVYQVYTMPLRVTDIYLEPGEKLIEQPFCGDTTRWNIGGGVSRTAGVDTQHLYLKPSEEGLETTLIVNTDRRIYHLIIKSFKDTFMMAVMWHYPGVGVPADFLCEDGSARSDLAREARKDPSPAETAVSAIAIDPVLMSSDYTVRYPKGEPPQWLPTLVLDDGAKTYIVLPDTVVHHELPAAFGENGEIVNFRVKDNVIVIDRLLRKMQLKLRDVTVEIRKKGA